MANKYVEKSKIFAQMILSGFRAPDMTVVEFVDNLPTADVQEVKHGKWEHSSEEGVWHCSVCLRDMEALDRQSLGMPDYCPTCGAKMDGGSE